MITGQGISTFGERPESAFQRLSFNLVNAGPVPAIAVQGDLLHGETLIAGGNDSRVGAIMPHNDDSPARILFDVRRDTITQLFGASDQGDSGVVSLAVRIGYDMPSGHTMRDHFQVDLIRRSGDIQFHRVPDYGGKTIVGMRNFLLPG
jgi:hypothetical protein